MLGSKLFDEIMKLAGFSKVSFLLDRNFLFTASTYEADQLTCVFYHPLVQLSFDNEELLCSYFSILLLVIVLKPESIDEVLFPVNFKLRNSKKIYTELNKLEIDSPKFTVELNLNAIKGMCIDKLEINNSQRKELLNLYDKVMEGPFVVQDRKRALNYNRII